MVAETQEATRRVALVTETRAEDMPQWPEFAWTASLSENDRREMQREYQELAQSAARTHDWSALEPLEYAWRATADVLRDSELTAELLADGDPADGVPLQRP